MCIENETPCSSIANHNTLIIKKKAVRWINDCDVCQNAHKFNVNGNKETINSGGKEIHGV